MKSSTKILESDWPRHLRLLVNKQCNYSCSFPGTCEMWCHRDGFHTYSNNNVQATVDDFKFLVSALKEPFNLTKVKIGAMEPLLFPGVEEIIKEGKRCGYKETSLTTNGFFLEKKLELLKAAGLDVLTVSMHAFNRGGYLAMTRVDGFNKVKKVIEKAVEMRFKKIKVNRVLLSADHLWGDLMSFFDWATKLGIRIKLYKLIWSPGMDEERYFESYIPWKSLLPYLKTEGDLIEAKSYTVAGRERLLWRLKSGLEIETDNFSHKLEKGTGRVCKKCKYAPFCLEGLLSYGLEINSELFLTPCMLREKIRVSLWDEVKARNAKAVVDKINSFIGKIV
jgi:molybdenum cofactor biosynthesis enzyme MoaA